MPTEAVLGRVTAAWRKGRCRSYDRSFWRVAGLLWLCANPLGFFLLKAAFFARRLERRIYAAMAAAHLQ